MNNKKLPNVFDCSIIELPRDFDRQGNLTPIEGNIHIPFDIKRIFYIYDIPGGADRGAHAHKECHQVIIAVSGSFEIRIDDGINKRTINLNRPYYAFNIPPGIWSAETSFSSGAICLVLASHYYDSKDYIQNYEDYLKFRKNNT